MKTTKKKCGTVYALLLTSALVNRAVADATAPTGPADKNDTGMITAVDPQEHTVELKGLLFNKRFNLGDTCQYKMLYRSTGSASDLRPGEKIAIAYQNSGGVLVADRVEQLPVSFAGTVKTLDPVHHTITVHEPGLDKVFQLANDCNIQLRNEKP